MIFWYRGKGCRVIIGNASVLSLCRIVQQYAKSMQNCVINDLLPLALLLVIMLQGCVRARKFSIDLHLGQPINTKTSHLPTMSIDPDAHPGVWSARRTSNGTTISVSTHSVDTTFGTANAVEQPFNGTIVSVYAYSANATWGIVIQKSATLMI